MNEVINYNVTDAKISELKEKYKETTEYPAVSRGISEIRTLRTSVEKKRKELKADALEWGRKVDTEAKRITGMLLEIENPLKAIKSKVDEEKARVKAEKDRVEKERIDAIKAKIEYIRQAPLEVVGADTLTIRKKYFELRDMEFNFQEFENEAHSLILSTGEKLFEAMQERESLDTAKKEAEEEAKRLENLRLEREAEQAKIDEANRLEREKLAEAQAKIDEKNRLEAAKLKEQQDRIDEANKIKAANLKAEQDRIDEANRILEEEKLRIKLAQEAKEKAEKDAKELKEREAKEKAEKEEADRLAKEREEVLRPDKEKLKLLTTKIDTFVNNLPSMKDNETIEIVERVETDLIEINYFINVWLSNN